MWNNVGVMVQQGQPRWGSSDPALSPSEHLHLARLQRVSDHHHGKKYSPNYVWLENHFLGAQKIIES